MTEVSSYGARAVLERIRAQAAAGMIHVTLHAHQEMAEEEIALEAIMQTIETGVILEHYPEHRRGPCGLISGTTRSNRPLHIVCTTEQPSLIIITVYEPKPPKWVTPTQRRELR